MSDNLICLSKNFLFFLNLVASGNSVTSRTGKPPCCNSDGNSGGATSFISAGSGKGSANGSIGSAGSKSSSICKEKFSNKIYIT